MSAGPAPPPPPPPPGDDWQAPKLALTSEEDALAGLEQARKSRRSTVASLATAAKKRIDHRAAGVIASDDERAWFAEAANDVLVRIEEASGDAFCFADGSHDEDARLIVASVDDLVPVATLTAVAAEGSRVLPARLVDKALLNGLSWRLADRQASGDGAGVGAVGLADKWRAVFVASADRLAAVARLYSQPAEVTGTEPGLVGADASGGSDLFDWRAVDQVRHTEAGTVFIATFRDGRDAAPTGVVIKGRFAGVGMGCGWGWGVLRC